MKHLSTLLLVVMSQVCPALNLLASPGDADNTFQQQGTIDAPICAVAVDIWTNIWIGGRFLNVYGTPSPYLAMLNPDGSLNTTLGNVLLGSIGVVHSIAVDDVANIYVSGAQGATRLNRIGQGWVNDTAFQANASAVVRRGDSIAVSHGFQQSASAIIVAGSVRYTNGNGAAVFNVAVLRSDGTVDTSFIMPAGHESDQIVQVRYIGPCACGTNTISMPILLFSGANGVIVMQNNLVDYIFSPGYVYSCAAMRDQGTIYNCGSAYGEVLAGGFFDAGYNSTSDQFNGFTLDRFGGTVPNWFHDIKSSHFPHDNGSAVAAIETFQGGDLVIAGAFSTIHDVNKANFAHLFADGSIDANFTGSSDPVFAMAVQPDGKFILAGETGFSPFGGRIQRRMGLNGYQTVSFAQQPTNQTVFLGESTCFQPNITGTPPPTSLLWIKDNAALTSESNLFLCISGATASDAGDYRLRAEKFCGSPSHLDSATAHLTVLPAPPPPPNDMFSNAIDLVGTSITGTSYIRSSMMESGEPNHAGQSSGRSVWWKWTAPFNGRTRLDPTGSDFSAAVGVYKGTTVSGLTLVTNGFGTNLDFTVVSNTTYRIAVGGTPNVGSLGNVVVRLNPVLIVPSSLLVSNGFHFQVTGPGTGTVVMEATLMLDPATWQPLATNSLTNGVATFNDPTPATNISRFYRVRLE